VDTGASERSRRALARGLALGRQGGLADERKRVDAFANLERVDEAPTTTEFEDVVVFVEGEDRHRFSTTRATRGVRR
jgi:hypothetical protein